MASTSRRRNRPATKLTEDVVAEILYRLPAKSFFRFQCVSKSWLALTSDPFYQSKLPCTVSGLFYNVRPALPDRSPFLFKRSTSAYIKLSTVCTLEPTLSFLAPPENIRIVDCSNGLILCSTWNPRSLLSTYFVCNPATKKWAALPERFGRLRKLVLAFDPRRSPHYHVIHFKKSRGSTELETYSSKTGKWGECQPLWDNDSVRILRSPGVYHEGIIYKLAYTHNLLMAVYLEREVHRRIELPSSTDHGHMRFSLQNRCIGLSGGYLHYAHKGKTELQIWVLKDLDNNQWILKHRADIKTIVEMNQGEMALHQLSPFSIGYFDISAFHPDGNIVYLQVLRKLFAYNWNNARLEEVCAFGHGRLLGLFVYTPCFSDCFRNDGI
ncbi:F-box protein At5g07610-like [Phoenix dactylifera]|uniref:F-box protein At5g07610-like n=1 Tax=Phoenix dactylifera TaxID=42345 RepID=A0A8B8ZYN4_PHODC|nr:F-box protein At5g07610-like [Phoenix dactylifera]XP_038976394.1 F-box protein At5g07610-like [Phoenix dactylifera]